MKSPNSGGVFLPIFRCELAVSLECTPFAKKWTEHVSGTMMGGVFVRLYTSLSILVYANR